MARKNPHRIVLPDGLLHIVVITVNGHLIDPICTVDALDAEARVNEAVVAYNALPVKPVLSVTRYKVKVLDRAREVSYDDART